MSSIGTVTLTRRQLAYAEARQELEEARTRGDERAVLRLGPEVRALAEHPDVVELLAREAEETRRRSAVDRDARQAGVVADYSGRLATRAGHLRELADALARVAELVARQQAEDRELEALAGQLERSEGIVVSYPTPLGAELRAIADRRRDAAGGRGHAQLLQVWIST